MAGVAVVGGGFSGLGAAHALARAGYDVEVIERDDALGGRARGAPLCDREVTLGGKNVGKRYTLFREFAEAYGGADWEPFGINTSRSDNGGGERRLDTSARGRGRLQFVRGAPARDLARFGALCARVRARAENGYLGSRWSAALGRRRDHRPLSDYFTPEFARMLLRPVTVRMNGAEPDEMQLGSFPANVGTLLDSFDQLRGGLGSVLERFAGAVPVELGATVERLDVAGGRVRGLRLRRAGGAVEDRAYDAVVLATPAAPAAAILADDLPGLAAALGRVRYHPAAVVVARYERPVFTPEKRAAIFAEGPLSNAGAYGASDLDVVRYTFSGRGARDLIATSTPEQLLDMAEEALAPRASIEGNERVGFVSRHWTAAYCGYLPYHGRFLRELRGGLAEAEGLALAGDYLRGVSIEACFRAGRDAARAVERSGVSPR
jgi:oxygen-dependent protoporphyrinogen oxidase